VGDPSRAAIIKAAVGELGLLGVVVDDGAEAIEFLREVGPASLAIIDLNLPRKTGFDVIRKIRNGPHGPSVRILAISLVSTLTDALVGQDLAVDEVLESWSPLALERSAQRVLKGEGRGRSSRPATAQTPTADPTRLKAVHSLGVVDEDCPQDQELEQLMTEVADAFSVPIAMISFILEDRQWFKAHVGVGGALLKARGTPLKQSFCRHVVDSGQALVVPDAAAHPAFHNHELVVAGIVGSYLGAPVSTAEGLAIGTLCIIDQAPHAFSARDVDDLTVLARRVAGELAVRSRSLKSGEPPDAAFIELDAGCVALATPAFLELFGKTTGDLLGTTREQMIHALAPQFADPADFVRRTRVGRGPFIAYGDFEMISPRRQRVRWLAKPVTAHQGGHRIQELFVALK
jgi:GAF domain-containing protein